MGRRGAVGIERQEEEAQMEWGSILLCFKEGGGRRGKGEGGTAPPSPPSSARGRRKDGECLRTSSSPSRTE